MATLLASEQIEQYHRDGYVTVGGLITPEEIEALKGRIIAYTHGGRPWGQLRVQVEPRIQRGEMQVGQPGDGTRKIELLVEHDDLFQQLGLHERIVGIVEQILGPDLKMFRNALMLKPPKVGSAKGMHQDSPYWPIEPMDLCSLWLTLDEATLDNGCMEVIPGEHKRGALPHVSVTDDYVIDAAYYDSSRTIPVPLQAGDGLFFHSLIPHCTAPNRSDKWRRAMVLSYMSARSRYTGEGESPIYFHIKGQTYPECVR